ncbi:hypothetical protein BDZ89DRAFT_1133456 [Hymenopellis radicata]|nr:hypothetical protein BDZ89DRAFT_1133456 [Hymenopellis radicata]
MPHTKTLFSTAIIDCLTGSSTVKEEVANMKWKWHRKSSVRESGYDPTPSRSAIHPDRNPLPQELINQIVDDLVEKDAKDNLTRSCREDLLSCSVTSRSFRAQTIQYLFRTVDPQMTLTTHAYYAEFLDILSYSPHIARSYRALRIRDAFPPIHCQEVAAQTLSLLINVSEIEVMDTKGFWDIGIGQWSTAIRAALAALPIARISFEDVDFPGVDDFVHLVLDCFPRVEYLYFHRVSEGPRIAWRLEPDVQRQTLRRSVISRRSYIAHRLLQTY